MSQINYKDIEAMNEIATSLKQENVQQLQTILEVPSAIVEKNWERAISISGYAEIRLSTIQFHKVPRRTRQHREIRLDTIRTEAFLDHR